MTRFNDYNEAVNEANKTWGKGEESTHVYKDFEENIFLVLTKEEAKTTCNDTDRFYLVY